MIDESLESKLSNVFLENSVIKCSDG